MNKFRKGLKKDEGHWRALSTPLRVGVKGSHCWIKKSCVLQEVLGKGRGENMQKHGFEKKMGWVLEIHGGKKRLALGNACHGWWRALHYKGFQAFTGASKLPFDLRGPTKPLRHSNVLKHLKLQPKIYTDMENYLPYEGLKERPGSLGLWLLLGHLQSTRYLWAMVTFSAGQFRARSIHCRQPGQLYSHPQGSWINFPK